VAAPAPAASEKPAYFVHPSSIVDEGCTIGAGTKIWFFNHVQSGSRIGRDCIIGQNVNIDRDAVVGDRVKIQNNVSVYKGVVVEDDAFLGPSMVFTNVINPRSHVNRKNEFLPTRIGKGSSLGANSTIVCGHNVGAYAFVGAGAVVTRDVPDYALVTGNPARVRGWVCQCAVKLSFSPTAEGEHATCSACGKRYAKVGDRITWLPEPPAGA
jgi:UDP-2-acetamido-3-amino-2,3-dideoxy-glucuronate N-acetyltransferase